MQITVLKSDLLAVLKRASASIATGDAIAYKSCVLIDASASGLTVSSTDDVTSVYSGMAAKAKKLGRALLPHRRLTAIANELPEGESDITVSDKLVATFRSPGSRRKSTMQGIDPDIFPKVAEHNPGAKLCSMESKSFQQATADAMLAVDEGFIFGACLVVAEAERFQLVSLDGRAMVVTSGNLLSRDGTESILIPQRLMTAAKLLPPGSAPVAVHVTEHKVSLVTDSATISCNRLAIPFPPHWARIVDGMPKDKRFRVNAEAFLDSVRAVSVAAEITEGDSRIIQIDIAYKDGSCLISTRESETNRGEDELAVDEPSPGACFFHINGGLLATALRSFGPELVDVYYGLVEGGGESLFLKSDTLIIAITPIRSIK